MRKRIFVLNEPFAPRLNPALAEEIGLNESIIFLQLEFWISISDNEYEGKKWTYQSLRNIQKFFKFFSKDTINRAIKSLENQKLIEIGNFNKYKYDNTRWFTIDYEGANSLKSVTVSQFQGGLSQNDTGLYQNETTIPETTPDTKSKQLAANESLKKELEAINFSELEIRILLKGNTADQIADKLKALKGRKGIRNPKLYFMKILKADYPDKDIPVIRDNGHSNNDDDGDGMYKLWKVKPDLSQEEKDLSFQAFLKSKKGLFQTFVPVAVGST